MKFIRFLLIGLGIIPAVIIGMIILTYLQRAVGYYPGNPGWEVAEIAVSKGKGVDECKKILGVPWIGMGPSTNEQRRNCIHEYAKLTKDPSACELLMPSQYGLSCVGGAENHQLPCNTDVKPYSVYWRDGDAERTVNIRECANQNTNRTELGNQCCQIAFVAFLKNENDCSSLKTNTAIYDRCLYALSWKLKDPTYCSGITNENARAACAVQSKALQTDPSICRDCKPAVESIEELE